MDMHRWTRKTPKKVEKQQLQQRKSQRNFKTQRGKIQHSMQLKKFFEEQKTLKQAGNNMHCSKGNNNTNSKNNEHKKHDFTTGKTTTNFRTRQTTTATATLSSTSSWSPLLCATATAAAAATAKAKLVNPATKPSNVRLKKLHIEQNSCGPSRPSPSPQQKSHTYSPLSQLLQHLHFCSRFVSCHSSSSTFSSSASAAASSSSCSLLFLLYAIIFAPLFLTLIPTAVVRASTLDIYKNARLGHRIVQTRYGRLHGLILPLDNFRFLRSVEVFLGVPYATPPTKQNRFSPTRAPAPWDGIRISDKYSPVCPQRLPNIQNETAALEKMPKGRLEYLKRLLPYLAKQDEDCLYLNIFSPLNAGASEKKLPVIVFIHGESFEWSSGNPYDGSVLASYGEVVVVTLNYRLGILGFLNANPNPQSHARVANYGLMDQMAALHWIQQNIQKFGGDPNAVTLAGHGTGAACINFLMTSATMVRGLFQRAILMSGSAYSSWALVEDPVMFAIKLAKEVNCSIPEDLNKHHEQIVDCLREVPLEDLYGADIQAPNFLSSFGPSVDGVVIRAGHSNLDIDDLMARNSRRSSADGSNNGGGGGGGGSSGNYHGDGGGYFSSAGSYPGGAGSFGFSSSAGSHYDVLFGVVTGESIWRFSAHDIQNGFEGERRDKIIRTYVRNAYNYHLNEIFYTIVNEYTDWDRTSQHPINTRDTAVAALSDAQFVAPIVRTGDLLAANSPPPMSSSSSSLSSSSLANNGGGGGGGDGASVSASTSAGAQSGRCYFYVFDYQTKDGDYPQRMGTVHGEDLPYIFGAPLVDGFSHFPQNYTKSEIALSEAVINFWTNFARTGNPNEHHRQESVLPASKERNRFRSITWENYDPLHQKYLEIGMKPRIKNHFRAHQLSIWLRLIPELHRAGMEDVIARHNLFKNHDDLDLYEGPVKPDPFGSTRLLLIDDALMKKARTNATEYVTGVLGVTTVEPNMYTTCIPIGGGNYSIAGGTAIGGGIYAPTTLANATTDTLASSNGYESAGYAAYSTALSVTIAIGCSLLILNVLIFAGVYYQRDKTRLEVKTLQKQYAQRSMHQQVPYPPEPIKHAHYHMGHSQSANVIVDVENHGDQAAMLLTTAGDVKQPPPHICANSGMQLTAAAAAAAAAAANANLGGSNTSMGGKQQQQQQQPPPPSASSANTVDVTCGMLGAGGIGNITYSTSTKQQQQQQQHQQQQQQQQQIHQQQQSTMQIKAMGAGNNNSNMNLGGGGGGTQTFGRAGSAGNNGSGSGSINIGSNVNYNPGMMTLPKAGGNLHHTNSINYGRNPGGGGGGGMMGVGGGGGGSVGGSMAAALLDARGNMLLAGSLSAGTGDCMTLPRNLSASSRHNIASDIQQQYQQQQQQQQSKHQPNGNVMNGMQQQHHIRAPRPPIRTASSTPTASLVDQTPSNGSSNSGVSSAPSTKGGNGGGGGGGGIGISGHTHHHTHTHSHMPTDNIGMTTTSSSAGGGIGSHHQQQVPQAAIDEMRV